MKTNGKRRGNVLGALFLAALGAFWTEPAAGALPTPVKPDDPWYPSSHAYYQLQDVSGRGGHTAAGSQWFATAIGYWDEAYRRDVCGGQAPGVAMIASADLVSGFDSVYLQGGAGFEPAESIALVLKEGSGILSLDFGNACRGSLGAEDATEDVLAVGLENDYRTRVEPGQPVLVASGDRLHTEINFQAQSQNYGSRPGYLTFRQSTRSGSESINIPLVVANVYDGLASDAGNELFFDITVFGGGNMEPVTRKKFRWGAGDDHTENLGNFFLIQQPGAPSPVYRLQNRITNRTGTRYRQQRYDRAQDIIPDCWLYDIADPGRYDLPEWFYLDARSQIAPGLITQYSASMDMAYNYSESFRLYPFQGAQTPRELQLTSQKVRGMTAYGTPVDGQAVNGTSPWTVTAFHMTFADVTGDGNTEREISGFVGGRPIMPPEAYSFTEAADDNSVPAGTLNAFTLSADVPEVPAASSNDAALLPIHVRLRLSRRDVGIQEWEALESAENALGKFAETRTIRVHSPKAPEKGDLNLLQAAGGAAGRCVQAFTHGDFLYIDFIVLVADAKSRKGGNETAFCEVVEDGGIPYILIGDGESDGKWVLSFYIGPAGSDPNDDPGTPANGDSGGGCSAGLLPFVFVLPALPVLPRFRKIILSR